MLYGCASILRLCFNIEGNQSTSRYVARKAELVHVQACPTHTGFDGIFECVACVLLSSIVLIQFVLVGLGQWLPDEYDDFARLAQKGWSFFWDRLKWSPRPISEAVFCAYGWVVNHTHRPLIGLFLGVLWAVLIIAGLITFWQSHRDSFEYEISPNLSVSLALIALFVAGGGHTLWVFYWPAAAVAYLPTISATILLFLQVVQGRLSSSGGRILCGCCLVTACLSSETGAIFVCCYGFLQGVRSVLAFRKRSELSELYFAWWILPSVISLVPLVIICLNRFQAVESPGEPLAPGKGDPLISLISGVRGLLLEVLGKGVHSHGGWHGLGSGLVAELLLLFGVGLCWSYFGRLSRQLVIQIVVLIAALLLSSILTISVANLHFGLVCCDQHENVRRCWILISMAGMGVLSSGWMRRRLWYRYLHPRALSCVLLCAAVLSAWHIRPVLQSYRMYAAVRQATDQNFQSGFQVNKEEMTFLVLPYTLVAQPQIAPGKYTNKPSRPADVQYVLAFFKKSSIVVLSPNAWLHAH